MLRPIELDQRIAAIAERIEMAGIDGKARSKLSSASSGRRKLEQRHSAAVEQLRIARIERQTLVVACQRFLEPAQKMENQSKAGKTFGAAGVVLERRLDKHQRRVETTALTMQLPEAVQCVEIFRMILQQRVV